MEKDSIDSPKGSEETQSRGWMSRKASAMGNWFKNLLPGSKNKLGEPPSYQETMKNDAKNRPQNAYPGSDKFAGPTGAITNEAPSVHTPVDDEDDEALPSYSKKDHAGQTSVPTTFDDIFAKQGITNQRNDQSNESPLGYARRW
jgi:hypothetical protein